MAHFAQLDADSKVINVIVVGDQNCLGDGGVESEQVGIDFCRSIFGPDTNWAQTSVNRRIRKNLAEIGYTFDHERNAFIPPSPHPSWVLNEETCQWEAPIPMPATTPTTVYVWKEEQLAWEPFALDPTPS